MTLYTCACEETPGRCSKCLSRPLGERLEQPSRRDVASFTIALERQGLVVLSVKDVEIIEDILISGEPGCLDGYLEGTFRSARLLSGLAEWRAGVVR